CRRGEGAATQSAHRRRFCAAIGRGNGARTGAIERGEPHGKRGRGRGAPARSDVPRPRTRRLIGSSLPAGPLASRPKSMKTGGWAVGAALLLSSAPLIAADEDAPVVLEPTSPWNVHYADDYCRLARVFGAGASRVTLVIDKFGPGDGFNLTLAGPRMKFRQSNGVAKIRFGTEFPEQQLSFHSGSLGEGGPAWVFAPGVDIRPLPIATAPAGSIR